MSKEKTSKAHCKAKTKNGTPCKMKPTADGFCFNHSPTRAADRAAARRAGGLSRHTPHAGDTSRIPADVQTIADARGILNYTLAELLVMDNSIARARALLAAFDSFVKAFEIGELEARIAALEAGRKS
jgi:hypothetical protein